MSRHVRSASLLVAFCSHRPRRPTPTARGCCGAGISKVRQSLNRTGATRRRRGSHQRQSIPKSSVRIVSHTKTRHTRNTGRRCRSSSARITTAHGSVYPLAPIRITSRSQRPTARRRAAAGCSGSRRFGIRRRTTRRLRGSPLAAAIPRWRVNYSRSSKTALGRAIRTSVSKTRRRSKINLSSTWRGVSTTSTVYGSAGPSGPTRAGRRGSNASASLRCARYSVDRLDAPDVPKPERGRLDASWRGRDPGGVQARIAHRR